MNGWASTRRPWPISAGRSRLEGLSKADRVRATFDRGVALDALERTGEAISEYSAALKLDAGFAPALNNRANAYRRLGKLADAKRDYMAALASANSSREYPYYGLGRIAEAEGDNNTARKYYVEALAANPGYVPASQSLAVLPNQIEPTSFVLHPPGKAPAAQPSPDVIVLHPPAKDAVPHQRGCGRAAQATTKTSAVRPGASCERQSGSEAARCNRR